MTKSKSPSKIHYPTGWRIEKMANPAERALVIKALLDGLGGGVIWDNREAQRVVEGGTLVPREIRRLLIEHVRRDGGDCVRQRDERRERWMSLFDYVYEVVIPHDDFKHGLYVEMRLSDDDPEVPVVVIVNAHPQLR